jgi:hypothetical protein
MPYLFADSKIIHMNVVVLTEKLQSRSNVIKKNVQKYRKKFFAVGDSEKSRMWTHCMSCLVHFLLRVLSTEASG